MRRTPLALAAILAALPAVAAGPGGARQQALLRLLRQDCGSCHGMTLRGGLGSPLTPEALAGKPDDLLVTTILDGRPGTAMPPWRSEITPEEARWLVARLRRGLAPREGLR
ncbi:c-type cytochrome [Inmirania thermothiophila]|uniref:Cytochrome c55X n=1 Tax=Inmirania thermothiophila TaxID=1750597 RepID=A0A3N1XS88_9GAMM|nr:cytochrome c [Inmirania thermothiophila]ROR29519.1 cytochrome c55X [Inmirania thermothiophila]